MSAATSAVPWRTAAVPHADPRPSAMQRVTVAGAAGQGLRWVLRRNCSIAPAHMLAVLAVLSLVSLGVGLGFWAAGAPYVVLFAGVEVLALGTAVLVTARHATDRETLTLVDGELAVEQQLGNRRHEVRIRAEWLSIEPAQAQGSLIELAGQGQRLQIGRFLRPEHRPLLARELRVALRRVQAGLPPDESEPEIPR